MWLTPISLNPIPDGCLFHSCDLVDLTLEAVVLFPDLLAPFLRLLLWIRRLAFAEKTHPDIGTGKWIVVILSEHF
jgi:hypothetical protein